MKQFAIVNLKTKRVDSIYKAESNQLGKTMFGGPWNDPSLYEHVLIPDDLEFSSTLELEPYDGQVQVGIAMEKVSESIAHDTSGNPVKDPSGVHVVVPIYEPKPIMKPMRLMRKKS